MRALPGLADSFRCLLLDRPGCGLSEPLPDGLGPAHQPEVADLLLAEVLDGLGLEAAHVAGTSRGGYDVIRTAAAHPGRVDRLVLYGWCLGTPDAPAPLWLRLGALPGAARLTGAITPTKAAVRAMLRQFGLRRALAEERVPEELLDWLVALYRDTDTLRHEAAGAGMLSLRRGWDDSVLHSDGLLAAVAGPTCLLWGEDDPFGGAAAARGLARRLPAAQLHVLPRAGHAPWLDEPGTCLAVTREFLGAED